MYRKLFAFILLTAFSATAAFAQDAPKAKEKKDKAKRSYSIAIGGGGFLGVSTREVSNENYQSLGLSEVRGVVITRVSKDSAAEKAGLQKDDVIVAIDGQRVTSTRKFSRMVREVAPDHKVDLTIVRGGSEMTVPVTMGKRSLRTFYSGDFEFPTPVVPAIPPVTITPPVAPDFPVAIAGDGVRVFGVFSGRTIGVRVTPLTKQLGDYFGVTDGKGLLISEVSKDSPAERAGLRAGDVIVEVDGKPVKRSYDLLRSYSKDDGNDVQITFVRDRARQTISVTPEKRKGSNYRYLIEEKVKKEKEKNKDSN